MPLYLSASVSCMLSCGTWTPAFLRGHQSNRWAVSAVEFETLICDHCLGTGRSLPMTAALRTGPAKCGKRCGAKTTPNSMILYITDPAGMSSKLAWVRPNPFRTDVGPFDCAHEVWFHPPHASVALRSTPHIILSRNVPNTDLIMGHTVWRF